MQAYLARRWVPGLAAHVSDFRANRAASPIAMSAVVIAIADGTENSHWSATGTLPGGESMITENAPGALRSVWDGGTRKDWPNRTTAEIDAEMVHLVRDIIQLRPMAPILKRHNSNRPTCSILSDNLAARDSKCCVL